MAQEELRKFKEKPIDKVCYDLVKEKGKEFNGFEQFAYAEHIGLGSAKYNLIEV